MPVATGRPSKRLNPLSIDTMRKSIREMAKGAKDAHHEQVAHTQGELAQREMASEAELKREARMLRVQRFVARMEPEKRERTEEFLQETIDQIEKLRQQGVHPELLKDQVQRRLKWYFEELYPKSPINDQRIRIVMRWLKSMEAID